MRTPASAVEDRASSPLPAGEGASAAAPGTLPEPPTIDAPPAETAAAVPAEAARLSPAAASALFGRSSGGFTQWTNDHRSRPVLAIVNSPHAGASARGGAAAPFRAPRETAAPSQARSPAAARWPSRAPASSPQHALGNGWSAPRAAYSTPQSQTSAGQPNPIGAAPQTPASGSGGGDCADCDRAVDSGYTNDRPHVGREVGTLAFEGRCKDGYIYRVTNVNGVGLPSHLVSNDGEVWNVGSLPPGQSMVIHSSELLTNAAFMNL